MSFDTLLVILLVWTVAGLLAAIAFGKAIRETSPREDQGLVSADTFKYFRKSKGKSRGSASAAATSRNGAGKRIYR